MNLSAQQIKRIRAAAIEDTAVAFGGCTINYINAVVRETEKPKNKDEIKDFFDRTFAEGIKAAKSKMQLLTA